MSILVDGRRLAIAAQETAREGLVLAAVVGPCYPLGFAMGGQPAIPEAYDPSRLVRAVCAIAYCRRLHAWVAEQEGPG